MDNKEAAQSAYTTRNQFLAKMSHEIRAPIFTVMGMSEALLYENLNDRQLQYVKDIKAASVALLDTINDILDNPSLINNTESNKGSIYAPDAKILVVDDNLVNLNVACGLLQLSQIKAETVASGKQAIELIEQKQYDLVFMNHMMPEMSGVEATKIIRGFGVSVPIIALMSANAAEGTKEALLAAGMNDFLLKPIIKSELNQMLKDWLPAEKILTPISRTIVSNEAGYGEDKDYTEFWDKIEQIEELSLSSGLSRVENQRFLYKKTLQIMVREIEKRAINLKNFLTADDMQNFRITIHGLKGSLANIGANVLSFKARELEIASGKGDDSLCAAKLPSFLEELEGLRRQLKDALGKGPGNDDLGIIPPELPLIFERLTNAFVDMDFDEIKKETEKLEALELSAALKEEIEHIKDEIMMMDYESAEELIKILLADMQLVT